MGIVPNKPIIVFIIYLKTIHSIRSIISYSNKYAIKTKVVFSNSSIMIIEKILLMTILFWILFSK